VSSESKPNSDTTQDEQVADALTLLLHDHRDAFEEHAELAIDAVKSVQDQITEWISNGDDTSPITDRIEVAMGLAVAGVSKRMAKLTTQAVRLGAVHGRDMTKAARDVFVQKG